MVWQHFSSAEDLTGCWWNHKSRITSLLGGLYTGKPCGAGLISSLLPIGENTWPQRIKVISHPSNLKKPGTDPQLFRKKLSLYRAVQHRTEGSLSSATPHTSSPAWSDGGPVAFSGWSDGRCAGKQSGTTRDTLGAQACAHSGGTHSHLVATALVGDCCTGQRAQRYPHTRHIY